MTIEHTLARAAPANAAPGHEPLDTRPFAVALWNVPAERAPEQVPEAERPPPPFAAELIAMVRESSGDRRAAIYDQELGQLVIAGLGEQVGRYNILAVEDDGVELSDGQSSRWLRLEDES